MILETESFEEESLSMLCINKEFQLQSDISNNIEHKQNKYSVDLHFSFGMSRISHQKEKALYLPCQAIDYDCKTYINKLITASNPVLV